jgi:hypothetical protein
MKTAVAVAAFLALGTLASHSEGRPRPRVVSWPLLEGQSAQAPSAAQEQLKIDPAKEAHIRQLLELTGTKELVVQTMSGMEKNIRPMLVASLPAGDYREKLIDLFFAKFHSKTEPQQLVNMAVPVYDKYFSDEEIQGLAQFYGTPLGHKTLQVLPKLMSELQSQGQEWGQRVGRESMEEVLAEHPELAKALQDAQRASHPE